MQKKLVDKLIDECTETIEEVKLAKITLAQNENKCSSCKVYIVLMIVFTIFIATPLNAISLNELINRRNKTNKY